MPELAIFVLAMVVALKDHPLWLAVVLSASAIIGWIAYLILRHHWHKIPKHSVSRQRSFAKAASWRLIGSVDTFGIVWLASGNLGIATVSATAEIITKIAWFYLHERVWDMISWGHIKRNGNETSKASEAA